MQVGSEVEVTSLMTAGTDLRRASEASDGTSAATAADLMSTVGRLPEVSIPIASLVPGIHLRITGVRPAHVQLLAAAAGAAQLPSILVQRDGMRIIDGRHRVEAAKLRGEWTIQARVVDCSDEEALVLAVKANTLHGLPLTRAERISSARRILDAHPDWSDRKVAGIAGLSGQAIASLRNSPLDGAGFAGKRVGRDGKRRPVAATEGRLRAVEYAQAHPEASVRQIARAADVSLGTAHDVRQKVRSRADQQTAEPPPLATQPARPVLAPMTTIRARAAAATAQRLAGPALVRKLAGDPSLRYTEGGRDFLRWLTQYVMRPDEWREFVDAVPERWLEEVRQTAAAMSDAWDQFANQLGCRQEQAS